MFKHWCRIGFTWLDGSVCSHLSVQPEASCLGVDELGSVMYTRCLNPTLVQQFSVFWLACTPCDLQAAFTHCIQTTEIDVCFCGSSSKIWLLLNGCIYADIAEIGFGNRASHWVMVDDKHNSVKSCGNSEHLPSLNCLKQWKCTFFFWGAASYVWVHFHCGHRGALQGQKHLKRW